MKKIIAVILSLAMFCTVLVVNATADDVVTVELKMLSPYTYGESTQVKAEIIVENNPASRGFQLSIVFPEEVKMVEAIKTDIINGYETYKYLEDSHTLNLIYANGAAIDISGKIADLTIIIYDEKLTNPGELVTKFTVVKVSDENVKPKHTEAKAGAITVECAHPEKDLKAFDEVKSTCKEHGHNAGKKCTFCGEITEGGEELPLAAHSPAEKESFDEANHWYECTVCNEIIEQSKESHSCEKYSTDTDNHWHECTVCGAVYDKEVHSDNGKGFCKVCDRIIHDHDFEDKHNKDNHWKECRICNEKQDVKPHNWDDGVVTTPATCYKDGVRTKTCVECPETITVAETERSAHTPSVEWYTEEGSGGHWHICTVKECGTKIEESVSVHNFGSWTADDNDKTHTRFCSDGCGAFETKDHTGGTATCTDKAVCAYCETEYGAIDSDNHADGVDESDIKFDDESHYNLCKHCGEKINVKSHSVKTYADDSHSHWDYCTGCDYKTEKEEHKKGGEMKVEPRGHWYECEVCKREIEFDAHTNAQFTPEKVATSSSDGNLAYWFCPDCGKFFFDDSNKIGAGPYDNIDLFITKRNAGCNSNHVLVCAPMNDIYHLVICRKQCGFVINMPHDFGINGICVSCGYAKTIHVENSDDMIEVDVPVEGKTAADEIVIVK